MASQDDLTRRFGLQSHNRGEDTEMMRPEATVESDANPHADALVPGTELGAYVIDACIGEGGGGVVYAARRRTDGSKVAIKVLRAEMLRNPGMIARFAREASAVNQIRHPNIIEVYEFGEISAGRPYYVMELLEGMDLRRFIDHHGRCSPAETLALIAPVCRAVQAAHDAGIIHRDIKANNVLLTERDGKQIVKLLDFGIAKLMYGEPSGEGLTDPGTMIGTAHAMAPEQVRCERVDGRADVYAIGVLLFHLLTGRYPFQAADPRQVALMQLHTPAPRPSSLVQVSPALDAVVLRCLEKAREKRFASAAELLAELQAAVGENDAENQLVSSAHAVGAYFEVRIDCFEPSDEAIEDMSNVLDRIERELNLRGYSFPLRTTSSLLAVCLVPEDASAGDACSVATEIRELQAQIERRPERHPDVQLSVSARVGEAMVSDSPSGAIQVVGGSLLEIGTWAAQHRLEAC